MEAILHANARLSLHQRARLVGLLSGLSAAGLLNAIIARILMRIIALLMFGQGSFTVGGTAVIFIFGALVGPLFGWIYRSTLYKMPVPEQVKGLLFGLILLVTLQLPGLVIAPEFRSELMAVGPLGFAIFTLMNFSFVLTLALMVAWLEKVLPRGAVWQRKGRIAYVAMLILAFAGLLLLAIEMLGRPLGLIG